MRRTNNVFQVIPEEHPRIVDNVAVNVPHRSERAAENAAANDGDSDIEGHEEEYARKNEFLAQFYLGLPDYNNRETYDLIARNVSVEKLMNAWCVKKLTDRIR